MEDVRKTTGPINLDKDVAVGELKVCARLSLPSNIDVRAVTKLHEKLYVLTYPQPCILVYAKHHDMYTLYGKIDTDNIYGPQEMVGCDVSNCVYVTDSGNRCVWRIAEVEHRMTRWLEDYSWTVQVIGDGKVVMPRWGQPFSLEIYRPDAVLARRVQLPANVELPKHLVENSKGNFVMSHWDRSRMAWGISEVNDEGEIVRCYDPRNELQCLDDPCYLSIDCENRIFVSDCHNRSRVILLDSQLQWKSVLLNKNRHELLFPKLLHYDRVTDQLIVVHGYRRKVIDVFNVRTKENLTQLNVCFKRHH